jgi:RNA polymerase sigma factor (sigma-70 family)
VALAVVREMALRRGHVHQTAPDGGIFRPSAYDSTGVDLSSLPDGELVARCRGGDDEAWRELVDRFSRYVYAIATQAYRLAPHDAEDVFQEVFARTYERLDRLRDADAVRPWIAQMTRNLCVDRLREGTREGPADDEIAPPDVDERMTSIDDALSVHAALAALPDHCREILDLFFCRDESYRTIAERLELPAGTIASRISRCLGKLRDVFEGRREPAAASGTTER